MKIIFGLGNPGASYEMTRHNIGFQLLDYIANEKGVSIEKKKFNGLYGETFIHHEKVLFVKPLSYMNLSGMVISKFVSFYKVSLDDILVIHDDLDMSFGRVKIVYNHSSGGHNGIKDIEKCVGSQKYMRLKIGISRDDQVDVKDYVLSKFLMDEQLKLKEIYQKLVHVVDDFCVMDRASLMNRYNQR